MAYLQPNSSAQTQTSKTSSSRSSKTTGSKTGSASGVQLREAAGPATYVVRPGDSMWEIAQNTLGDGTRWMELWAANRAKVPNPHALVIGTVLTIPGQTSAPAPAPAPAGGTYTVKPGDTLSAIAARELGDAGRWQDIYQANRHIISNPSFVQVGWVLKIPGKGGATVPAPTPAPAPEPTVPEPVQQSGTYRVKSGDTLSAIAAQLLGSAGRWREIYDANRHIISNPGVISVGWVLTIPGHAGTTPGPGPVQTPTPAPPIQDDGSGMAPDGPQAVGNGALQQQMAAIYNSKGKFVKQQADALGIEAAVAASCLAVESGGSGYVGGKLKIRFEAHIFKNLSGQYVSVAHTGSQADEYDALNRAKAVNHNAAYESISMGAAQIMGFNAQRVGYSDAKAMFDEFQASLSAQLSGMFEFVRTSNVLHNAAKQKDWATFAKFYNGAGYAANAYDVKLANAYAAYKAVTQGLPYS